jgi:D-aminoacyl-tRNA deacylase
MFCKSNLRIRMRAVVQRVNEGSVFVDGEVVGAIGEGLVVFLGVGPDDTIQDVEWLAKKISLLRVFTDDNGKMSLSVQDKGGDILVISQFTLYGDCRNGNRPDFTAAAPPEKAEFLYNQFLCVLERIMGKKPPSGIFRAKMDVSLVNQGPVTLVIESK